MDRSSRALAAVVVAALVLLGASFRDAWAGAEPECAPAITTATQAIRRADGAIVGLDVSTQATASHPTGDRLVSVAFTHAVNTRVEVDGRAVTVPTTISLPSPSTWTFRLNRVDVSQPFQAEYTVRDLCGDVVRFAAPGRETGDPPVRRRIRLPGRRR